VAVLAMRFVDLYWLVMPNFPEAAHGIHVHWLDVAAPVAIGGVWMAAFVWHLRGRPLVPLFDPRLQQVLEQDDAAH
ncbi:MAG: hypothetical protein ACRD2R_04620, partial [Terriglobales bacterium]